MKFNAQMKIYEKKKNLIFKLSKQTFLCLLDMNVHPIELFGPRSPTKVSRNQDQLSLVSTSTTVIAMR
jgi:hypothetical protein